MARLVDQIKILVILINISHMIECHPSLKVILPTTGHMITIAISPSLKVYLYIIFKTKSSFHQLTSLYLWLLLFKINSTCLPSNRCYTNKIFRINFRCMINQHTYNHNWILIFNNIHLKDTQQIVISSKQRIS